MPNLPTRNNNPGDLRDPSTGSFRTFATPDQGFQALKNDLNAKITGATSTGLNGNSSLLQFANAYAPASDGNNPTQYATKLATSLGVAPTTPIGTLAPRLDQFANAVATNEGYQGAAPSSTASPATTATPAQMFTPDQFAQQVKAKYPAYADIPNADLVQKVLAKYPQYQNNIQEPAPVAPPTPEAPSVFGFSKNVLTSGANLLGNTLDAITHPIQTVQGIGSAAAGGLQELGGQQNQNTQNFDGVVNYFKNRYGGVSNLENTIYTDPVGFAADLSTVLGGAGAALKGAGTAAGVADASRAAQIAGETGLRTMAQDSAVGNVATRAGEALGTASNAVNPFTPILAGAGRVAGSLSTPAKEIGSQVFGIEPKTIQTILENPDSFTSQEIANSSRASVANEVKSALDTRLAALSDTAKEYQPFRDAATQIAVPQNFLEDMFRKYAGVDVVDGRVVATGASTIRDSADIRALQSGLDLWKPEFQKGYLTSNEFLNLRQDLGRLSKFDRQIGKSAPVENVAKDIRAALNTKFRPKLNGLASLDEQFSTETATLKDLKKGILDRDGNLTLTATNKIANAVGKGKDMQLAKLEQIIPGITKRLEIQKAIEDINASMGNKVGTYGRSLVQAGRLGGAIAGVAFGRPDVIALAIATDIFTQPQNAVALLRKIGGLDKTVGPKVIKYLARYLATGAEAQKSLQGSASQTPPDQSVPSTTTTDPIPSTSPAVKVSSPNTSTSIEQAANAKGFDIQGARSAGYSDPEISQFLNTA